MIRHAPSIGIGIGLSLRSQGFGVSYVKAGRVLDYSTQVGPFTIVDKSGESNTATLYSGRGLTMDAVNDSVTYATGYSLGSQTATVWMRVDTLGTRILGSTVGGAFLFTPTATGVWEELTHTRLNIEGDLLWLAGSDCDIGDLRVGTEHWTHNDWSDPSGNTSNGKTIVDSGPNQLHGTCTGCSGFTGEATIPQTADKNWNKYSWFNGVDTEVSLGDVLDMGTGDFYLEVEATFKSTGVAQGILSKGKNASGNAGYDLRINADGTIGFVLRTASTTTLCVGATTLTDGQRYLIRVEVTRGSVSEIYLDGVLDGTEDISGLGASSVSNTLPFYLGRTTNNSNLYQYPYTGVLTSVNINGQAAYTGLGNDPWKDTIGTNDGTEAGTFTRELVTASDANIQIDALGTAISEPRLNTQQLNLFGDGEYSRTPDSASLDVTTTATWEVWGNFYGATATTVAYISKYNAPAGVRSWNVVKSGSALDDRIKMQFGSGIGGAFSGSSEIIVTDAMACITFVFGAGSLLAYIDGLAVSTTESGAIPASLPVTSQDIYIGKENEAATTHVDTKIGSAKIYNVALTADEVLTNYNTQKSLYGL